MIDEVIAANPKQVEQYRAGKKTMVGFFVGQVMKASKGQAISARERPPDQETRRLSLCSDGRLTWARTPSSAPEPGKAW